jgi:hypothetical protein
MGFCVGVAEAEVAIARAASAAKAVFIIISCESNGRHSTAAGVHIAPAGDAYKIVREIVILLL